MNTQENGAKIGTESLPVKISQKFITTTLRQVNYDLETALSEFVDNSIDAGASIIKIDFPKKNDELPIKIIDNGDGMSYEKLKESMVLGSDRQYDDDELGYYGIGLKSAAAYLGIFLKIVTKLEKDNYYSVVEWDIESPENMIFYKKNKDYDFKKGTIIEITKGYRINEYSHTQESHVIKMFSARYFHAISNDEKSHKPKLYVNDILITPIDPMYRHSSNTLILNKDVIIEINEETFKIDITGYQISKHRETPSLYDKHTKSASGFQTSKHGVYLRYNNRFICMGGWLGCVVPHPDYNYIRVEVNIPKSLTQFIGITFNKNSAHNISFDNSDSTVEKHVHLNKIAESIREISSWGRKIQDEFRKSMPLSKIDEDNKEQIEKKLNNKLKNRGFKKTPLDDKKVKDLVPKIKDSDLKKEEPKGTKNRPNELVYDKRLVKLSYYQDDKNNRFWRLEQHGNTLYISFNTNHSFYKDYIKSVEGTKFSDTLHEFLTAIAFSELETYKYDSDGAKLEEWDQFWFDVSRFINKFSE